MTSIATLADQITEARQRVLPGLGLYSQRGAEYAAALDAMNDDTRRLASYLFTVERHPEALSDRLYVYEIPPLHVVLAHNIAANEEAAVVLLGLINEAAS